MQELEKVEEGACSQLATVVGNGTSPRTRRPPSTRRPSSQIPSSSGAGRGGKSCSHSQACVYSCASTTALCNAPSPDASSILSTRLLPRPPPLMTARPSRCLVAVASVSDAAHARDGPPFGPTSAMQRSSLAYLWRISDGSRMDRDEVTRIASHAAEADRTPCRVWRTRAARP